MASKNLLDYIWEKQIMPQSGYGFSDLHGTAYSLIALQNMNLAYKFPTVYWNTACLSVNSGADETSDADKSSNYGKVASAIGEMQSRGVRVTLPDINTADFGFKPNPEENSIVFGLRGIHGVGTDVVRTVIKNRPYSSFEDFLSRIFDTKLIQNQHVLQLIKAGCFDSLVGDRIAVMQQYIQHTHVPRKNLTLASFNVMINLGVVPELYDLNVRFYRYRQHIFKNPVGRSDERKTKNRLFRLDDISTEFLYEHFTEDSVVDFCLETGNPIVAEWLFDREYEVKMQPIREWLAKEETLKLVNDVEFEETWNTVASGTISKWEMSSLSYYYHEHELEHLNKDKYGVVDFRELPAEPEPVREYEYRGQTRYEYQLHRIAGTVLDKDKDRHTVTVLTTSGVVTVRLYRSNYSFYDRQLSQGNPDGTRTILERSWFTRGNLIMFTGFRRGNQFTPRVYRNSIYQNSVALIESIDNNGDVAQITDRIQV